MRPAKIRGNYDISQSDIEVKNKNALSGYIVNIAKQRYYKNSHVKLAKYIKNGLIISVCNGSRRKVQSSYWQFSGGGIFLLKYD